MLGLGNQELDKENNKKQSQSKPKNLGAFIDECLDKHFTMADFISLIESINSEDRYKQHFGIIGLRKLLSGRDPAIQPVIEANLVPRLIQFLSKEDEHRLQLEAAWAITNMASGTTQQMQSVIDAGAIPYLIKLLSCGKQDTIEQAIWALGNIAGDSTAPRDLVITFGGLDPLIAFVDRSNNEKLIKHGIWAISNLCRGRPPPDYESIKNTVPILSKALQECDDIDTLTDAAWALSYLCDGNDEKIEAIVRTNIVPSLVKHLNVKSLSVLIPILRIIGNIFTGNETQINLVLDFPEVLDRFCKLLEHSKKPVRRETCWVLSNLAAGPSYQLDVIIRNSKLLEKLIFLANNDVVEIRREACWTLDNLMIHASPDQMAVLFETDTLQTFCNLLNSENAKILELALEGIDKFLSHGVVLGIKEGHENPVLSKIEQFGAIESIENLQNHSNDDIYKKALGILEKYFETV